MFLKKKDNKRQQLQNSLSNLKRTEEYKDVTNFEAVFCARYCLAHRKELHTKADVKKCFDEALNKYRNRHINKLEEDNA